MLSKSVIAESSLLETLTQLPPEWSLTPVRGKRPYRNQWQAEAPIERSLIGEEVKTGTATGYGLRLGGELIALDQDGAGALSKFTELVGEEDPNTVIWTSGKEGRRQALFRLPKELQNRLEKNDFTRVDLKCDGGDHLEVRYARMQSVLPPSLHPETGAYRWINSPSETPVAVAPLELISWLIAWCEEVEKPTPAPVFHPYSFNPAQDESNTDALILEALRHIPQRTPGSGNYGEWMRILAALTDLYGVAEAASIVESFSPSLRGTTWKVERKAQTFKRGSGKVSGIGTIFHIAKSYGFRFPTHANHFNRDQTLKRIDSASPTRTQIKTSEQEWSERVNAAQAKLNTLTYTPSLELNQRYLGELPLPLLSTIIAISSACKTGKTESLKGVIEKHRSAYPNAKVLIIGYRNVLLKQTAKRLGIVHIQDLSVGHGLTETAIRTTREIALCLDSLSKIDLESLPAHTLIILDEGDATLKHGVEGGTLKGKQAEILCHFQDCLNKVLGDGGSVLLMEDDLTDLPIDTLNSLTGNQYPVNLTVNRFKPSKWDVSIGCGSKAGVTKRVIECLSIGERLAVPTSAQNHGEELEWIVQREFEGTKKVVRLDSKTVELLHSLVEDPIAWLKDAGIDLLIYSPTAESGFNIPIHVFDRVIAYFVSGETRSHIQLLERYRLDVPREIFCLKFSFFGDSTGRSLLPENILKDWKLLACQSAMVNQIEASLEGEARSNPDTQQRLERYKTPPPQQETWNQVAANYRARSNGASANLLQRLTGALIDRGHTVSETKWEKDNSYQDLHKEARRAIEQQEATAFGDTDPGTMTVGDANKIKNSWSASREDRLKAQKCLLQADLPGAPLDDTEFVLKALIENKGRLKRTTEFLFLCRNKAIASFLDRKAFESQLDKPFVMLHRFRHNRLQADLLGQVWADLESLADGGKYQESDPRVQRVKQWADQNSFEIRRILSLTIKPEHSAIDTVNKILSKRLGFECKPVERPGSGRHGVKRTSIWRVVNADCPHRDELLKALRTKWESQANLSASSTSYSPNGNKEVDDANPKTPTNQDDLANWLSPEGQENIKEWWATVKHLPDQVAILKKVVPLRAFERAIA